MSPLGKGTITAQHVMTRKETHNLLEKLENIEVKDGKRGFTSNELKEASNTLKKMGIVDDPKLVTQKSLTQFLVKMNQAVRGMPAKQKNNCRVVDCNGDPKTSKYLTAMHCPGTERTVCDTIDYSVRVMINDKFQITDYSYKKSSSTDKTLENQMKEFFSEREGDVLRELNNNELKKFYEDFIKGNKNLIEETKKKFSGIEANLFGDIDLTDK